MEEGFGGGGAVVLSVVLPRICIPDGCVVRLHGRERVGANGYFGESTSRAVDCILCGLWLVLIVVTSHGKRRRSARCRWLKS